MVASRPSGHWSNGRSWLGLAAAWSADVDSSVSLHVKRGDGSGDSFLLRSPVVFDPSQPFRFTSDSAEVAVLLVFQSEHRDLILPRMQGRLKALGCNVEDPEALVLPVRFHADGASVNHDRLLYIGAGAPHL